MAVAMKRNQSASPNWLVVALVGVAFTLVVGILKKCSTPEEQRAPQVVASSKAAAKPKRSAPAVRAAAAAPRKVDVAAAPSKVESAPHEVESAPRKVDAAASPSKVDAAALEAWRVRSNGVWSICEAATAGNMQVLLARIGEGENVNARDEMGNSPLHLAAAGGHVPVVYALLKAGADPMATNQEGKRPAELAANAAAREACEEGEKPRRREIALFDAVSNGRVDEVHNELEAGVNPNALSADNQHSLLTTAVMQGRVEVARALLAAGADPRYKEPSSRTALNHAAGRGSVELVEMLIKAGADPMVPTNHGAYPIHDAIWSGRTEAAIALIPYYKSENYSPDGRGNGYPISMAIGRGNKEVVRALLAAGLNPNDPRFAKEPLLVQAAKKNSADMVRMLLEAGANKNAKDSQGKRAADYATGELVNLLK